MIRDVFKAVGRVLVGIAVLATAPFWMVFLFFWMVGELAAGDLPAGPCGRPSPVRPPRPKARTRP